MPYFKFRIKESTWADVTVEAKNADDAREALDIYWVDNSHKVRDVMDRNTVCDTEFLAEVTENDESDLTVYDSGDDSDSKRDEPPKKAYGRYPYGLHSKVYLVHISDEFGETYCQDTVYYNFDKALQYISDGVEVARKEGGLKNASAVITDVTTEQVCDDVTWYNVDVKFYKNGINMKGQNK